MSSISNIIEQTRKATNEEIQRVTDVLVTTAGINPAQDRFWCGYIAGLGELAKILDEQNQKSNGTFPTLQELQNQGQEHE